MAENLSGVPPAVTLSGLDAGAGGGGFSGASQQSLGGAGGPTNAIGMEGGLDLNQLMQLLASQGEQPGAGTSSSLQGSVAQGSIGQAPGGLSAGSFGQTQPGYVAGQSSSGQGPAQQAAAGSADPFAILQKFLGTAQKGIGAAAGANTASPTGGGTDLTLNTNLGGLSGTGSPSVAGTASPTVAQDMQGTLGSNLLSDPTIQTLFTSGKLNGWDGSPESLQAMMATDPGIRDALFGGNVGGSLGEQLGAGSGGAGFTLGTGAGTPGETNWGGAAGGGLQTLGGLYNLYQALQGGNAAQGAGGGLQTIGGLAQIVGSNPALAQALGLSGGALGGIGGAVGGLGGVLGLIQGIQSGNPMQIGTGVLGTAQGASALSGALGGPTIASGLAAVAPETTAATLSALMGTTVPATATGIAEALSAAAAAYALPVAALVQIITDTLSESERERIQNAGFVNNPIKGALYSGATAGVGAANKAFEPFAGNLQGADTNALMQALTQGTNSLMPYYATATGGRGAIRASDTLTGGHGTTSDKALPGGDVNAYTQNAQKAQQSIMDTVNELMKRGVSYEQLGQLPVNGNWTNETLDANNPLNALYAANAAKYDPEGQQFLNSALQRTAPQQYFNAQGEGGNWETLPEQLSIQGYGGQVAPQDITTQNLFQAAQGQAGTPGSNAQGLVTGMTGGPLWSALSRMLSPTWGNTQPGSLQELIQQHFDPWAMMRSQWGASPSAVGTSLMPVLQSAAYQRSGSGAPVPGAAGGPAGF